MTVTRAVSGDGNLRPGRMIELAPWSLTTLIAQIASHGYRWIDYQSVDEATQRLHLQRAIATHHVILGEHPAGIYVGKPNHLSRRLVVEDGGFLYDSDSYADDLPYWVHDYGRPHLVIPYSLDCNDMRFAQALEGDRFFHYLRDAFDVLYAEGLQRPRMMSVGLHCRVVGRPGRALGLAKFMDYVKAQSDVWICQRVEIARHWHAHHPAVGSIPEHEASA